MSKLTFIFIGPSGCGKGTQAGLLMDYLKQTGQTSVATPLLYIETGSKFRDYIAGTGHSSRLSKEAMERSDRQPDFLAVWIWSSQLIDNVMGDEHIILDGTPRSLVEAQILDTAIKFYQREKVHVIYLAVSNDWSKQRLMGRGRADDQSLTDIDKRLAWFEKDVRPAVEYFAKNPDYHFHHINGEQAIDQVHQEIMKALNL